MKRYFRLALFALMLAPAAAPAQDRLRNYPGYEQFSRMMAQLPTAVKSGAVFATWTSPTTFEYQYDGKRWRYDINAGRAVEAAPPTLDRGGRMGPERGRQFEFAISPDSTRRAFYRERNLWLGDREGNNAVAITTEGSEAERTKYGSASWVYGEELDQNTAIWWSPDSRKVAFYGFDEKPVPDYLLQLDQTKLYSTIDREAYPKAGEPNPVVDIYVYDTETKQRTHIDIRDGKPFTNDVLGHYAYNVRWTPDGSELLVNRTNRRQNVLEVVACSPDTGKCRVVVREEWPTGWVENSPTMQFLSDGKRFIFASERTGFRNYYLYDLSGKLITPLTQHPFEVGAIASVDEKAGVMYYMARSGDNHMKLQLHRVGLNGKNDRRLTDPKLNHTVFAAPDSRHFVVVSQAHDVAPVSRLMDANGKVIAEIAKSDVSNFERLGLQPVELFTFKAADGVTDLHGMIHKPSNFDPSKKYPVLVSVYAGPATNGARETFTTPHPFTEFGFIVVTLDSRSAGGKGKRALDAIYQKLGIVEIDDQAAGVKALRSRPYIDASRVGIFGTSYGGYASAMALLRYPDVFQAASGSSSVTDWRHYDSIYTERYMWIPQENASGYDNGSAMKYVPNLKGRLLLFYGTADNNVHPNNTMQLIQALQRARKSFEVQVGPDVGHAAVNSERMMEFFIENLVLAQPAAAISSE